MSIQIDGVSFDFNVSSNSSIVEFAHRNGVEIPTLCFLKDCANVGKCGLCSVVVNGKKTLACKVSVEDGMEIVTANSDCETGNSLKEMMKVRTSKLLESHDFACGKCSRKDSCEFLELVKFTKARAQTRYQVDETIYASRVDDRSKSLVIDRNKCVGCSRCVSTCALRTTTKSLVLGKLPEKIAQQSDLSRGICPSLSEKVDVDATNQLPKTSAPKLVDENGKPSKSDPTELCLDDTNCLLCGQCSLACPVAAIKEKDQIDEVQKVLADDSKHVIMAIAPSIRAALGESFGLGFGVDVTGKIYSALRELGADKVFDINFAADVTILEEGTELLERISTGKGPFPMFTSCCPGWVRLVDNYAPELRPHLSTAKSPQQIFGAAAKAYYPQTVGIDPKDVVVVSIMPCTAKKFEAQRDGMFGSSGDSNQPDVDFVLTTRELALLLKKNKIKLDQLEDSEADQAMGEYTGAGTIFGITGGVMEAAIRTAADLASGQDIQTVDYFAVEGFEGVRESDIELQLKDGSSKTVKVAVINGAANFFELQKAGMLEKYHFVEVMACPGGCVNGGGQPHVDSHSKLDYAVDESGQFISGNFAGFKAREDADSVDTVVNPLPDYVAKRASVLRKEDVEGIWTNKKRKSHENEAVKKMYEILGCQPGHGKAHELFHLK